MPGYGPSGKRMLKCWLSACCSAVDAAQDRGVPGPAPIMTPPGFTLGEGWAAAPTAGARDAGPDAPVPVPVPATVVPQAASAIMRPAVMLPSAARLAAPSGLPSVLIATPFRPGRY